jgi:hypothetical protein
VYDLSTNSSIRFFLFNTSLITECIIVGLSVGDIDGLSVGETEGFFVGFSVGVIVGDFDG